MTGGHGAVAAGHELTVAAAKQALAAGGTAVDAAVAAAWMACVAEPVLASPGGGGFAMVGAAGETPVLCDFFAQTPKRRNPQAVFGAAGCDFGDATQVFHVGHGSTATPGFVPGLFALHERFGRLPMAALIGPAAQAAARGFTVTPFQEYLMGVVESILGHSASARRVFLPRGRLPKAGERFANPDLAAFLRLLAGGGLAAHAEDVIPRILGQQRAAGHLRDDDVADYAVAWRAPLRVQRGDGVVWLNPPPAAGGVMIALALAALDEAGMRDCPAGAMAAALAAADDARRAAGHDPQALLAQLGPPAHRGTTHISVIDGDGMACALTITNGEGNGHVVEGCGFMLNNMLGEADVNPDGLEGWPEDVRLSSMMAPTLAGAEDGTLVALGSGGSNRIRSAVFMVLARLLAAGRELAAAIDAPRLHVEADFLDFEPGFAAQEVARLTAMFPRHRAWSAPNLYFGGCHAVARKADGALVAAADKRREGAESVI